MELSATSDPSEAPEGSDTEFITEHYWGYARRRSGQTMEYRVEHPRWRVSIAKVLKLHWDARGLYGTRFGEFLSVPPASSFIAEGSEVTVYKGKPLGP